jgi:hypothetical protein
MVDKTLFCLKTITYADYSHSIISWHLKPLTDKASFRGHIQESVRKYEKVRRLVAMDGNRYPQLVLCDSHFRAGPLGLREREEGAVVVIVRRL